MIDALQPVSRLFARRVSGALASGLMGAVLASGGGAAIAQTLPSDSPAALAHVTKAQALAGEDLKTPLFLCRADSGLLVRDAMDHGSGQWQPPTRLFDNLFYIGDGFVGVLVVRTSAGLILFDSTTSADSARLHLVPDLIALGLDPKTIS